MDSGRLQPALYGGLFIGVLSALPIVKAGNCCCCLWVIAGGVLAVYLRQQNTPFAVLSSEGALTGLLAGVIGGVAAALISLPIDAVIGPYEQQFVERFINSRADFPPESREMIERMMRRQGTGLHAINFILGLVWRLFTGAIFGMLGGLLGVAMFKKDLPPPPPPGTVEVLPPQ